MLDDFSSNVERRKIDFGFACSFSFGLYDDFDCIDRLYDGCCDAAWDGAYNEWFEQSHEFALFRFLCLCGHINLQIILT